MGYDIQLNIYRLKFGVIQGFLALRKAVTTYVKKYDIFSCVWYRQSAAERHSPFALLRWLMNERQSRHHSQSKVVWRIFFGLWLLNTKKSVSLTDNDVQTFLEGEENQNTKRKPESYVFSGFSNGISQGWEWKLTTGRFATGGFWPCTWKISSAGREQFNNWKFCILKIRPIVCSCSDLTRVFVLSAPTHFTIFIQGLSILLYSFIN